MAVHIIGLYHLTPQDYKKAYSFIPKDAKGLIFVEDSSSLQWKERMKEKIAKVKGGEIAFDCAFDGMNLASANKEKYLQALSGGLELLIEETDEESAKKLASLREKTENAFRQGKFDEYMRLVDEYEEFFNIHAIYGRNRKFVEMFKKKYTEDPEREIYVVFGCGHSEYVRTELEKCGIAVKTYNFRGPKNKNQIRGIVTKYLINIGWTDGNQINKMSTKICLDIEWTDAKELCEYLGKVEAIKENENYLVMEWLKQKGFATDEELKRGCFNSSQSHNHS